MRITLDQDLAVLVQREAKAHLKLFKRRKSYNTIVNMMLKGVIKDLNGKRQQPARHSP